MEAIVDNLKDPSWWFSAFFVAIIASIIAAFLKERMEKWLGNTFSSLKSWRVQREAERSKVIEALLTDQTYFQMALFRAGVGVIFFAISCTLYFSSPVLFVTAPARLGNELDNDLKYYVWYGLIVFLGTFNVWVSYKVVSRLSLIYEVIRKYRVRNDLPKLL